ncbi:MAG TPA: STAS domain-containing protein [Gaiellales bacterium]|nr:STAS domain-containing protein [Gaiellales bacterium]
MAARDDDLVVCDGEWDIARAEEFARLAAEGLARRTGALILDFRGATFIDASTIGAIYALARNGLQQGVDVVVLSGPGFVRRVFVLAHLADAVRVAETLEQARDVSLRA